MKYNLGEFTVLSQYVYKMQNYLYDIICMQDLKKMVQMNLAQNRNRVTDVKNKPIVTKRGREGRDKHKERRVELTYTYYYI